MINTLRRLNRSKAFFCGMLFCFAIWLFTLNCLTPYIADDFTYMLSFASKEKIRTVSDIIPSMIEHSQSHNGRILAHSLEQLFLLAPKMAFNVANTLITITFLLLLYRLCNAGKPNVFLFFFIFISIWYSTPVFGQVFLWQDGALNYLWGYVMSLAFITPYVRYYTDEKVVFSHMWQWILFSLFSYFMGTYSEGSSFVAIAIGLCMLALAFFSQKTRFLRTINALNTPPRFGFSHFSGSFCGLCIVIIPALMGYLTLWMMPAERHVKTVKSLLSVVKNLINVSAALGENLTFLIVLWCILVVSAILFGVLHKKIIVSGVFLFASLLSTFLLIFGDHYRPRTMGCPAYLCVLSCAILLPDLTEVFLSVLPDAFTRKLKQQYQIAFAFAVGFFLIVSCASMLKGSYHIWINYRDYNIRELEIRQQIENGETDLCVDVLIPKSKYCALYNQSDLNADASSWPNYDIAKYYGVSSITGRLPK